MSVKIHHGPPGSYKTSGAVMDDLPPAVREGRTVITNVRGLSDEELIRRELNGDPKFRLIHVDTTTSDGLEHMRRWFHWAPRGALLIVDEAQRIWPPEWRDAQLRKLDYPGGVDKASEDQRPENHTIAFDMHRHYNWDFVLTTPDIRKIRSEIRGVAEGAFKHRNRAMVGLKGSYLEAFHSPENNGASANDQLSVLTRRIRPWVWRLYDSTATGEIRDTSAGRPFWRDPRILGLGLFATGIIVVVFSRSLPAPLAAAAGMGSGTAEIASGPAASAVAPGQMVRPSGAAAPGHIRGGGVDVRKAPLEGWQFAVIGEIRRESEPNGWQTWFELDKSNKRLHMTSKDLRRIGYGVWRLSHCGYRITYEGSSEIVGCRIRSNDLLSEPPSMVEAFTGS